MITNTTLSLLDQELQTRMPSMSNEMILELQRLAENQKVNEMNYQTQMSKIKSKLESNLETARVNLLQSLMEYDYSLDEIEIEHKKEEK